MSERTTHKVSCQQMFSSLPCFLLSQAVEPSFLWVPTASGLYLHCVLTTSFFDSVCAFTFSPIQCAVDILEAETVSL